MLALPSPKRCGIEIQTNGRATPLYPGAGGWVGKGRAEKAEETSDAEIDLNFDVVQMGFLPEIAVFFWEATSAFGANFIGDEHGFRVPETMKTFQSPRRSRDFFHLKVWRTWQKVTYSNSQMLLLHCDNSPSTTPWTTMSITVNLFLGR